MRNQDKKKFYNQEYWKKTKDVQAIQNKKWKSEHPERVKENMREWLAKNKEHKKQKDREYRLNNKDKCKENQRIWKKKEYMRLKEEGGEAFHYFRLKDNIKRRIREILGQEKSERCVYYVGCTLERLKSHLECTFKEGMTWDNYGKWHIDHIFPCVSFDISNDVERRACFHYTNLQALWGDENCRKKDNYDKEAKNAYVTEFAGKYSCPVGDDDA